MAVRTFSNRFHLVRAARDATGQVHDLREATLRRVVDRDDEPLAIFADFHAETVATGAAGAPSKYRLARSRFNAVRSRAS
jgi:hypothetical protein